MADGGQAPEDEWKEFDALIALATETELRSALRFINSQLSASQRESMVRLLTVRDGENEREVT
jgi:hypothetical protein